MSRQALVAYRGNRYSVPPELVGAQVHVARQLDGDTIDVATDTGIVIARHRLAADGVGAQVRDHGHVIALEQAAMTAVAASGRPHHRKERIPPGPTALAAANAFRRKGISGPNTTVHPSDTVIDLAAYERAATGRNTLTRPPPARPSPARQRRNPLLTKGQPSARRVFSSCAATSPR